MPSVLVPLANGFEEIEAVSVIDVLRRGGIRVTVAGVDASALRGANGVTVVADCPLDEALKEEYDMVVLPGGSRGTQTLAADGRVRELLADMDAAGKPIGAICAAPLALDAAGVLKKGYTCYPGCETSIAVPGYDPVRPVVTTDNVTTSRGPGTAVCFALELVEILVGKERAAAVKAGLLAGYCG